MTCIHPLDAIVRVGISPATLTGPAAWPRTDSHFGIGGAAQYFVCDATYAFRDTNGEWFQIKEEIRIAQLTLGNSRLPSLLGWDVLRHFNVALDHAAGTITLDPQSPG